VFSADVAASLGHNGHFAKVKTATSMDGFILALALQWSGLHGDWRMLDAKQELQIDRTGRTAPLKAFGTWT
jgi:hypothetical protein